MVGECLNCWGNEDFGMCMIVKRDGRCLKMVEVSNEDILIDKSRCEYCNECMERGCSERVCGYDCNEDWEEMEGIMINRKYMEFMIFLKEYEDYWSWGSKYMECGNCGSVMVRMYWCGYNVENESDEEFWGYLCGNCGNGVYF